MSLYEFERARWERGCGLICGVDEAGRGPLAGPVCAAAVILDPKDEEIAGVNDSKKLSASRREKLYEEITARALCWAVAFCDNKVIDEINILRATMSAMEQAVSALRFTPEIVYVDGNSLPELALPAQCLIHGDATSASIAAASILAKVSRDRLMVEMDSIYPGYAFAQHKGYGTKLHYERIAEHGICDIHRRSFLKDVL